MLVMSGWEVKHINHAIHPEAHTAEYIWHKYWARKPHNVVRQFIEHYCPPGGIVLDPFSGSGVTAIEAVRTGRRAIAVDINPIAIEILRATLLPVDLKELQQALDEIESQCREEIEALYVTKCRNCKKPIQALAYVWERDSGGEHRMAEVRYKCEHCDDVQSEGCEPSAFDKKMLKKIEATTIPYWYPDYPLKYLDGTKFMKSEHSEKLSDLFTSRNLLAVSAIRSAIAECSNESIKKLLCCSLTSVVHLCSRLCPALSAGEGNHQTAYSSTWTVHSYWIPPKNLEMNVWVKWVSGIFGHQGIQKAKKSTTTSFNGIKEAKTAKTIKIGKTQKTSSPYTCFAEPWLATNRIIESQLGKRYDKTGYADYVFTDPPYDAEIQYGELSALWNAWFQGDGWDWNNYVETLRQWEAVNNPAQGKDFESFSTGLYHNFRTILDALKPGAYMHLTFHSPTQKVRNATIRSAVHAGFIYEKIHYQPPSVVSAKAMLQPYGSAKGDFIFRFRKPESFGAAMTERDAALTQPLRDKASFNAIVIDVTKKLLAERGEPVPFTFIINHLDPELNKKGYFLAYHADWNVEEVLAKSGEFIMKTIKIAGKEGRAWWYQDETEALRTLRIPLTERVEKAVLSTLKSKDTVDFTEALDRVYLDFPNSLTPDSASVKTVLQEYAEQSRKLWRLTKREIELASLHDTMIANLIQVGTKLGFESMVGKTESSHTVDGMALSTYATGDPDFSVFSKENTKRLKQVDCIWHKDGEIKYVIEVEHTTQFTEAMIRSQVFEDMPRRLFVVPSTRIRYIQKRLDNQLFSELIKRQGWRFLTYEKVAPLPRHSDLREELVWGSAIEPTELARMDTTSSVGKARSKKKKNNSGELFK